MNKKKRRKKNKEKTFCHIYMVSNSWDMILNHVVQFNAYLMSTCLIPFSVIFYDFIFMNNWKNTYDCITTITNVVK